jgi:hypothetical protein
MLAFGMAVLLGLATFAAVAILRRLIAALPEVGAVAVLAVGVGVAWLVNFNLFREWGLFARWEWVAITLTGLAIGGIAYAFERLFELVRASIRMVNDKAEGIEVRENLRRVA